MAWRRYRLRWRRRRLVLRGLRALRDLGPVRPLTGPLGAHDIPVFAVVRNEYPRLAHFLDHHRALGAGPFLIVDNASTDETSEFLLRQPDVFLWRTEESYRASRFGMDWISGLMFRHAHGRWALVLDADELLIYPDHERRGLQDLVAWLDGQGARAFGTLMVDLYPKGPILDQDFAPGDNPLRLLEWFDADPGTPFPRPELQLVVRRGGVRARALLGGDRQMAPVLNKTPLVRWSRRHAWLSSTHALLPPRLNRVRGADAGDRPTGALLHTKFLPDVGDRSREELARRQHFVDADA
ncbi:MAG: glycosyltransferase family 2 protein, partial [Alphaproteobacteria bacterium]